MKHTWVYVLGAGLLLHVALLRYFTPSGLVFSGLPIHTFDYALHVYQVDRALTAFRDTGHLWSYDPFVLAGQRAGVVEDLTSKSLELFVIVAARAGVDRFVAFNLYVFLVHLGMPLAGWAAARLFRLSRLGAALTVLFWIVLWHFDSVMHWFWYVGMISWAAASALVVLIVALLYRALADHRPTTYALLVVTTALTTLVHPFAAVTLVLPLGAQYARSFKRLAAWEHAALVVGVVAAGATTLVWIFPVLRFRRDIGDVDAFLWPTLRYVFFDWFDLLKDVLMTGQPVRSGFRVVVLAMATVGLVRFKRENDPRFLPLVLLVWGSFLLSYVSGYSTVLRQTQPYRNLGPAALAAAIVAAALASALAAEVRRTPRDANASVALLLAAVVAVPELGRTVLGYVPTTLPERDAARSRFRAGPIPGASNDELPLLKMGHRGPSEADRAVGDYLERTPHAQGRVAAFDWVLGEYLPVFAGVPTLGGIPQRNVPEVAANPIRRDFRPREGLSDPLGHYLEEYAVSVVVSGGPTAWLDVRRDLLEKEATISGYELYRVRRPSGYFALGEGRVVSQKLNSIVVDGASGAAVVLRFHWLSSLRCRPNCAIRREPSEPSEDDAAGFVRIDGPPPKFEIYNAY